MQVISNLVLASISQTFVEASCRCRLLAIPFKQSTRLYLSCTSTVIVVASHTHAGCNWRQNPLVLIVALLGSTKQLVLAISCLNVYLYSPDMELAEATDRAKA